MKKKEELFVQYDRWTCAEPSTWPFQVFKKYNEEFERMFWSHVTSAKFAYGQLGKLKAKLTDPVEKYFDLSEMDKEDVYKDVKDWSSAFNMFDNWVNLNGLMAISANLETYMASVIKLALESDPGVLIDAPKGVDGIYLLKYGRQDKLKCDAEIVACTKGDWGSRITAYERIFGSAPKILREKCGDLDAVRRIRNNLGHSFGRDIAESRKHGVKKIIPMEVVSRKRAVRYKRLIWSTAKLIDMHLLKSHIGDYQAINFYHQIYSELQHGAHASVRAMSLKKAIGRSGAAPRSKLNCKSIVDYYESL